MTKVDRDAAYELVTRELMAAGVSTIRFAHLPKGARSECSVGAWERSGPLGPDTLRWIADNCRPRGAAQKRDTHDGLYRCARCGCPAVDHVVDGEERRECRCCECTQYEWTK